MSYHVLHLPTISLIHPSILTMLPNTFKNTKAFWFLLTDGSTCINFKTFFHKTNVWVHLLRLVMICEYNMNSIGELVTSEYDGAIIGTTPSRCCVHSLGEASELSQQHSKCINRQYDNNHGCEKKPTATGYAASENCAQQAE